MEDDRSLNSSSASTQLMDNLAVKKLVATTAASPTSPTSNVSKNALAASRLLRNRKDRGNRAKAAQQLMERLVPNKPPHLPLPDPPEMDNKDPIPPASPETLRNRVKNRHRGTGGAYAKLMIQGPSTPQNEAPKAADESGDDVKTSLEVPTAEVNPVEDGEVATAETAQELDGLRKMAVAEFSKGPQTNMRYHNNLDEVKEEDDATDDVFSEASLPSILNRSEIFHENAAAAVVALLTPRQRGVDHGSVTSSTSTLDEAGLRLTPSNRGLMITAEHATVSAFRSPNTTSVHEAASVVSSYSTSALDLSYDGSVPRSPITEPILSVDAKRVLETVKTKMINPSKTLSDLLTNIASPESGEPMDRGFMVRRKNACGALKVLTATAANRRTLCWTVGVLPALASVLEDTDEDGLLEAFPDHRTRAEYIEARKRAVASLAVSGVIVDDNEESRQGCCALIAFLCKTQDNRLLMAQVPGLINALCSVIAPIIPKEPSVQQIGKKKRYHWDSSDDDDSSEPLDSFSTYAGGMSSGTGSDRKKDNAYALARHEGLMKALVEISKLLDSPSHVYAVKILANVTRHRANAKHIVFKLKIIVPAMVQATKSTSIDARQHALFAIQNLSQDRYCRQEVANTKDLILALCQRARQSTISEEKLAAISGLKNLTDDPANLIPLSNTAECFATLMQIAHDSDVDVKMQYIACDALATLSHWLRKIATSGSIGSSNTAAPSLFVPSLKAVTFDQWT
ncbi:hypothetical protein MHU86_11526 [Fragilaria crotonensis]|nr:hypothetical protein MHU86_11526 [Fragilaria crotonensis]